MEKFYTSAHEQQARVDDNERFDVNKYSSFDNQAQCNVTKLKEIKSIVQSEDVGEQNIIYTQETCLHHVISLCHFMPQDQRGLSS